jgi:orotate phosphoribosyltransferase
MDALKELSARGALLTDGHFIYRSGRHGSNYINMDHLFPDVLLVSAMAHQMAQPFVNRVDAVVSPATGGIVLSTLVAQALGQISGTRVLAVWADKDESGRLVIGRSGFKNCLWRKRVLIVDDILTTGSSLREIINSPEMTDSLVVGVSVVCNRGGCNALSLDVPRLLSLAKVDFESKPPRECALCAAGVPITENIGHGAEFKLTMPDYRGGFIRHQDNGV